eukprot:748977-Hanusia_phi.AAC.1
MKKFVSCLDFESYGAEKSSKTFSNTESNNTLTRNNSQSSSLSEATTESSCGGPGGMGCFDHPSMEQIVLDKKNRFHIHEMKTAASEIEEEVHVSGPMKPSKAEVYFFHELSRTLCRSEAADWFASQVLKGHSQSSPDLFRNSQGMKRNSSVATFAFSGRQSLD